MQLKIHYDLSLTVPWLPLRWARPLSQPLQLLRPRVRGRHLRRLELQLKPRPRKNVNKNRYRLRLDGYGVRMKRGIY